MWGVATALTQQILVLMDNGMLSLLYQDSIPSDSVCTAIAETDGESITVSDMSGLLFLGGILSLVLLLWKLYEIYPYVKEILNRGKCLEDFLLKYLIIDEDAVRSMLIFTFFVRLAVRES